MKIAIFGMEIDPKWVPRVKILLDALTRKGGELCYYSKLYHSLIGLGLVSAEASSFSSSEDLPKETSLVLALGGDGTFLNSLSIVRDSNIPVAGINFGRLGFLTTAKVSEEENGWIDLLIEGKFNIQKRSLLKIDGCNMPDGSFPYALNEISIQRKNAYMIGIDLKINGCAVPTYWADGLLVATPTGSTAYSLSVGGPIVAPGSNVFIIAPIAPHNLNIRPLIVSDSSELEIVIRSKIGQALLTIDNRSFCISSADVLKLGKAGFQMNNVTFSKEGFFAALQEKLLWGEDKRNNA